jgi:hypothetical protein
MRGMKYFDYESVAADAGIASAGLTGLRRVLRAEFPDDDMMYELHLLRACMAIRDGRLTIEKALEVPTPSR